MLTFAPAWSTAVGRTLKPCRVSGPQLACLILFYFISYCMCPKGINLYYIFIYTTTTPFLCGDLATPHPLYLIIGILLFNIRGVLESQTVPGQLSDRMFQSISVSAGLTTIYFYKSPISKVLFLVQGWVKVSLLKPEPNFPHALKFGVVFQIHPLNQTGFQCSHQNNPYLICLLAAKQQEDCQQSPGSN